MTSLLSRRALIAAGAALPFFPALAAAPAGHALVRRGDRLFVAARVNGVAVEALLDSGAEMSVADLGFAARLALAGGKAATARGTGSGTREAKLVPHVRIEAAGLTLADRTLAVIDLADVGRRLIGHRLDMIVGRDLFDAGRLAIDIGQGRIAATARTARPAGRALPLVSVRGNELMPAAIEGRPVQATFDLGNGTGVLVSRAFAAAHLLDGRATGTAAGGGIGGAEAQTTLTLKSLTLAGRSFANVPARIDDSPHSPDANIGVGILQHFRITADFPQHRLWLDG